MRLKLVAPFLALLAPALLAQNPGQHVAVDIQLTTVTRSYDTTGISYVVTSLPASTEQLGRFSVDAPAGVLRITTPSPANQWATATDFNGRPLAAWIGGMIPPGSSTPELHFEAVGLPGILTHWAGGVFVFPSKEEPDGSADQDPLVAEVITGQTVGIEAWPTDRTAQALLARLRVLTQTSCGDPLRWVSSPDLCSQLISDLDQAESFRAAGQTVDARNSMTTFISAISGSSPAPFAAGVNSLGYWLLKSNADIVVSIF